jgi:aspartate 1-decarboxylase
VEHEFANELPPHLLSRVITMFAPMLLAKIHRATVTDSNLDYEGSITLDEVLMAATGIQEFAQVQVYNCTNGHRFETYTIKGTGNSGMVCVNGAAAHLAKKGDIIIICRYGLLSEREIESHRPVVLLLDGNNGIKKKTP